MTTQGARNFVIIAGINTYKILNGTNGTLFSDEPWSEEKKRDYKYVCVGALIVITSGIVFGVCMLMREKQKRIQESVTLHDLPWVETLEIFTVSGRDAHTGMFLPQPIPPRQLPPPAYDAVITTEKEKEAKEKQTPPATPATNATSESVPEEREEEQGGSEENAEKDDLPSYEAAVKMEGNVEQRDKD